MEIRAVIDANYGDSGKGLMTDYFCHQALQANQTCIVVLHNGGSQRSHTVTTPEGISHAFKHFGAGTFVGADTYFASSFILNPMTFREEWEQLVALGYTPKVYTDRFCLVTTPFDMILNQIIEESRGKNRHGSCGMGIDETIQRYDIFGPLMKEIDGALFEKKWLERIRDEYVPYRLKMMGITYVSDEWNSVLNNEGLIEHYIEDAKFMLEHIEIKEQSLLRDYDWVIFENGQGLLLDQERLELMPHLTPSNTGCKNPVKIIRDEFSIAKSNIEFCYVSRTYLTRHGAGPMEHECSKDEINPTMVDLTNVPNPHQGSLRYGLLDFDNLRKRIELDFLNTFDVKYKLSVAFTHTNEYPLRLSDDEILSQFQMYQFMYLSDGKTRSSVKKQEVLMRVIMHERLK